MSVTDRQRVLAAMRRYGGVTEADFKAPNVIDGGGIIGRVAPRVLELRKAGFEVRSTRLKNGTARWSLVAEPVVSVAEPVESPALFDQAVGVAPPRKHYDQEAA